MRCVAMGIERSFLDMDIVLNWVTVVVGDDVRLKEE